MFNSNQACIYHPVNTLPNVATILTNLIPEVESYNISGTHILHNL